MLQAVHGWSSAYERLVKSQKFFSSYLTQEDLSRFGREHVMMDYYLEFVFPEKQIRYIAVTENEDTERGLSDFVPFKNLFKNVAYSGNVFHCFERIRHSAQVSTANIRY